MTTEIPRLDFTPDKFFGKTTIIYGQSGSGKSTIIIDILAQLKNFCDMVIVFSPTDRQNHTYEQDEMIPKAFIHYDINPKILEMVWKWQEANVFAHNFIEDKIPQLISKLPQTEQEKLARFRANMEEMKDRIKETKPKTSSIKDQCAIIDHYISRSKRAILKNNKAALMPLALTDDQVKALSLIDFNPSLTIIFDDCTDILMRIKNDQSLNKMFFQGRHNHISLIIATHAPKSIDTAVRSNAFMSIFTSKRILSEFLKIEKDNLTAEDKAAAARCFSVFDEEEYVKIGYIRMDNQYCRLKATIHPSFKFCSEKIRKIAKLLETDGKEIPSNNPFISDFFS